jgi:hypothetical protein
VTNMDQDALASGSPQDRSGGRIVVGIDDSPAQYCCSHARCPVVVIPAAPDVQAETMVLSGVAGRG